MPLYDRANLSVRHAASTDTCHERRELCGVHFSEDGSTEATNGHIAAIVGPSKTDPEAFPRIPGLPETDGPIDTIAHADLVCQIDKAIPSKSKLPILAHARITAEPQDGRRKIQAGTTDLDTPRTMVGRPIEGEFPTLVKVWPQGKPRVRFAFDARLLARLARIAKATSGTDHLCFEVRDPNGPIVVTAIEGGQICDRFRGLLMPVRLPEAEEGSEREPGREDRKLAVTGRTT